MSTRFCSVSSWIYKCVEMKTKKDAEGEKEKEQKEYPLMQQRIRRSITLCSNKGFDFGGKGKNKKSVGQCFFVDVMLLLCRCCCVCALYVYVLALVVGLCSKFRHVKTRRKVWEGRRKVVAQEKKIDHKGVGE